MEASAQPYALWRHPSYNLWRHPPYALWRRPPSPVRYGEAGSAPEGGGQAAPVPTVGPAALHLLLQRLLPTPVARRAKCAVVHPAPLQQWGAAALGIRDERQPLIGCSGSGPHDSSLLA